MTSRTFAFRFCAFLSTGILLTALSGCQDRRGGGDYVENSQSAELTFDPASITDADVERLAAKFLGDASKFPALSEPFVDFEKIVETLDQKARERGTPRKTRSEFRQILSSKDGQAQVKAFVPKLFPNGRVAFGGVRRTNGTVGAILRFEFAELAGSSYVVALVAPGPNGAPTVVDLELLDRGQTLSDAIANTFVDILAKPGDPSGTARTEARQEMDALLVSGAPNPIVAAYERKNYAKLQIFIVDQIYLTALGGQLFLAKQPQDHQQLAQKIVETSARIKAYCPNGVAGDLELVNGLFIGIPREKALETLANVRRAVGDDPYFDYVEGAQYMESDPKKALLLFREAGRKGLRSFDYLAAYYVFMKRQPRASKKATQKIYETGVAEHGARFTDEVDRFL